MPLTARRSSSELERTRRGLPLLDLVIIIAVVCICSVLQFREYSLGVTKTLMIETINLLRLAQLEQVERFGSTGYFDESDAEAGSRQGAAIATRAASGAGRLQHRTTVVASLRDLEEAEETMSRVSDAGDELGIRKTDRRQNSANTVVGVSAGVPTAVVKAPGMDAPLMIELRPAVAAEGAVLNWLCGSRPAPAWLTAAPPRSPAVPDHQLPIPCRVTP